LAAPRAKTTKRPVLVTTEDQPFAIRLREGIEKNSNLISIVVVGILLVALVFGGIQKYFESREIAAQQAYAPLVQQWPKEVSTADNQAWEKMISDLQKFVQEHSGSRTAWMAGMDLAQALYQARRYEEALAQSQKALDGSPDSISRNMARYQAAATAQALGRTDEAIAQWTSMKIDASLVSERELNWQLASLYRTKKDFPKTVEFLESSLKATGEYPTNQLLEDELASAKTMSTKGS
jgi:predicted negative regulator of RcsB-dependent stress response